MKKYFFLSVILCLILSNCASPEKKFRKAEKLRSKKAFEEFINDYPESELVERAKKRIVELTFWEQISSGLKEKPYQTYIDSFPGGLYIAEAQDRIREIRDFKKVREKDIIDSYTNFLGVHRDGILADSAKKRIEYLKPAQEKFRMIKSDTSIIALKAYINKFRDTGYGKLIGLRLDSLTLVLAESKILNNRKYRNLPDNFDSLVSYIKANPNAKNIKLAKQAFEDILIEQIKITGPGYRFIINDIPVNSRVKGYRYSMRLRGRPLKTTLYLGTASPSFSITGTIKFDSIREIIFTDYPDDKIPLMLPEYFPSIILECTGRGPTSIMDPDLHYSNDSVWRFYGEVHAIKNYTFKGNPDDPLSFYLMENKGAVFLHGKGSVVKGDSIMIFSN